MVHCGLCVPYQLLPRPPLSYSLSTPALLRYMAPEVFRHEPYNMKVDVYGKQPLPCAGHMLHAVPVSMFLPFVDKAPDLVVQL